MQTTLSNGKTWTRVESFNHKHPNGGRLSVRGYGHGGDFCDTRKIGGKRRTVVGCVYQCGTDGWKVIKNPGENAEVLGCFPTETAFAAWELATTLSK